MLDVKRIFQNTHIKKNFLILIVLSFSLLTTSHNVCKYRLIMNKQIDWLVNLQVESGAIRDNSLYATSEPKSYKITPYYANIAAIAMTKDIRRLDNVKRYIEWYIRNLNENHPNEHILDGVIFDYYITPDGKEFTNETYDSADSYAATFISLIRAYFEASKDKAFLIQNKQYIQTVSDLMIELLDKDNLSWAKSDYHIKYLMDNCEVYKGLKDAEYIFKEVYVDMNLSNKYSEYAQKVKTSILEELSNGLDFYSSKTKNSKNISSWDVWYPDATAQLYPVLYDVVSPSSSHAKYLIEQFNKNWDWSNLNTPSNFPWTTIGYIHSIMDYNEDCEKFYYALLERFYKNEQFISDPYFYSFEMAWFVLMTKEIIVNLNF